MCQKISFGGNYSKKVLFPRLSKIDLRQPKWDLVGPCAHHCRQQQRKGHQAFELGFFLVTHFAPTYISITRRRYAQKPLHRAAFTRRYSYAERFVQRNSCKHTPYAQIFTQRKKILYTDALYKDPFAHINKGTSAFLHTEPLPQRNLRIEIIWTHIFFWQKK